MTGQDLKRVFDSKKLYRGFVNNTRCNDLFREALVLSIEEEYNDLEKQGQYDDIQSLIKTSQVFAVNNNKIYTLPIPITLITPSASPTAITTTIPHNLITGDLIYLTGVAGTISTINAQFFAVTVTGTKTFTVVFNSAALVYTANTGQIAQHQSSASIPKLISDYTHLLIAKFKYSQVIPNVRIVDATNSQPITITLNTRNNNIKTGEQITNMNIYGNSNANGTFYVKKIGTLKYQLYIDKDLTQAASGNGIYTGGGIVTRPVYKYAVPLFSYKKVSPYDNPDIFNPAFERADKFIKALPEDSVCQEATIDYISDSIMLIDCTDSSVNLVDTYPEDFLYQIIDRAVVLFAERFKDTELLQTSMMEEKESGE